MSLSDRYTACLIKFIFRIIPWFVNTFIIIIIVVLFKLFFSIMYINDCAPSWSLHYKLLPPPAQVRLLWIRPVPNKQETEPSLPPQTKPVDLGRYDPTSANMVSGISVWFRLPGGDIFLRLDLPRTGALGAPIIVFLCISYYYNTIHAALGYNTCPPASNLLLEFQIAPTARWTGPDL